MKRDPDADVEVRITAEVELAHIKPEPELILAPPREMKRDLEADLRLCEAATEGPWHALPKPNPDWPGGKAVVTHIADHDWVRASFGGVAMVNGVDDAAFIAAAREALPHWLNEVRRLKAQVNRLAGQLASWDVFAGLIDSHDCCRKALCEDCRNWLEAALKEGEHERD
ncbi:MAG: hypothetical protein AB1760_00420 [Pseudomonadota bacterium]